LGDERPATRPACGLRRTKRELPESSTGKCARTAPEAAVTQEKKNYLLRRGGENGKTNERRGHRPGQRSSGRHWRQEGKGGSLIPQKKKIPKTSSDVSHVKRKNPAVRGEGKGMRLANKTKEGRRGDTKKQKSDGLSETKQEPIKAQKIKSTDPLTLARTL